MSADIRLRALDDWRAYSREYFKMEPHDQNMDLGCGFLEGARALLAFVADTRPQDRNVILEMEEYVEEVRVCYCESFGLDSEKKA